MKSSCIKHPAREPLIIIRAWQVEACDGDHCAAALLSFFEYWHNIRLDAALKAAQENDVAERHGDDRRQNESLTQWHSGAELSAGLLGLYQSKRIAEAVDLLKSKGFVRVFRNPNPRYKFDATKHFVFEPDTVNEWLDARLGEKTESVGTKRPTVESNVPTVESKGPFTIEETTSETTSETTPLPPANRTKAKPSKPVPADDATLLAMIPPDIRGPDVERAATNFIAMRREMRKPLTVRAFGAALANCIGFDREEVARAFNASVASGWQGVFPKHEFRPVNGNRNGGGRNGMVTVTEADLPPEATW